MSEITKISDKRLKRLFNALYESRNGDPFKDFIDDIEIIECCEYLVSEIYGKDFIDNWGYDETV